MRQDESLMNPQDHVEHAELDGKREGVRHGAVDGKTDKIPATCFPWILFLS